MATPHPTSFKPSSCGDPIPDNCGIIIELIDVPNPIPGWDSGSGGDVMESRVKSVTFVRDDPDSNEVQQINISFNEAGQIEIKDTSGNYINVNVGEGMGGRIFTSKITLGWKRSHLQKCKRLQLE